ncbi:hypothetical protein [Streptomyces sp. NPDC058441]|uniref:hypothetical protein n=1 Tax=Streptomyces sp. NPDC058441 TaxID=3346502 RepID=UPI00364E145B
MNEGPAACSGGPFVAPASVAKRTPASDEIDEQERPATDLPELASCSPGGVVFVFAGSRPG